MRWFTTAGLPASGPAEWDAAYLTLDAPGSWEAMTVTRNGLPCPVTLRRLNGQVRTTVDWPRSGPGHYRLHVTVEGSRHTATVTVHARKLPPGGFDAMLDDLHVHLPADVAISLKRAGGLAGIQLSELKPATLQEELARLRRAVHGTPDRPGLAALLPVIARSPHEILQSSGVMVRRELLKRPRPAALVQALSRSSAHTGGHAPRFPDERVQPTVDVYENRVVRACAHLVLHRLRTLAQLAARDPRLGPPVHDLHVTLNSALRAASFLRDVRDLSGAPRRLTMVLLRRPEYRAALEILLELQRSLRVTLDDDRLLEPLGNTPSLYQTWGALHVIRALTDTCTEAGFTLRNERIAVPHPGTLLLRVLPDGQPILTFEHPRTGCTVTLASERTFRQSGAGWQSVSFSQRPDLVIELRGPGRPDELWILDPKYKLGSDDAPPESSGTPPSGNPNKTDIDKMHSYRDAIRDPAGRRGVTLAAILYPGQDHAYGPNIHAISARPGATDSLNARLRHLFATHLALPPSQAVTGHDSDAPVP
ncbi:DUF2357 domain-containing protein [Deinococcus sp. JMULE3]|uniref:DUF2357 domain-containing protein n=1 Tax=Deinococcus sp. JMULE3 TaxID=2518341 RepID=UPI00157730E9|nr:DUF2357 domain-containing protein [Deinococcus sp. JMULE3]